MARPATTGPSTAPSTRSTPNTVNAVTSAKATPIAPKRCAWSISTGRRISEANAITAAWPTPVTMAPGRRSRHGTRPSTSSRCTGHHANAPTTAHEGHHDDVDREGMHGLGEEDQRHHLADEHRRAEQARPVAAQAGARQLPG